MSINLEVEVAETNLILEALGKLPFERVYQLIGRIQEQARAQLHRPSAEGEGESS